VGVSGLVTDGSQIFAVAGQKVVALGRGGEVKWRQQLSEPTVGAPALAAGMLILPRERSVAGLRLSDGELRWIAVHGRCELIEGDAAAPALHLLREKYPQYGEVEAGPEVIRLAPRRIVVWSADGAPVGTLS